MQEPNFVSLITNDPKTRDILKNKIESSPISNSKQQQSSSYKTPNRQAILNQSQSNNKNQNSNSAQSKKLNQASPQPSDQANESFKRKKDNNINNQSINSMEQMIESQKQQIKTLENQLNDIGKHSVSQQKSRSLSPYDKTKNRQAILQQSKNSQLEQSHSKVRENFSNELLQQENDKLKRKVQDLNQSLFLKENLIRQLREEQERLTIENGYKDTDIQLKDQLIKSLQNKSLFNNQQYNTERHGNGANEEISFRISQNQENLQYNSINAKKQFAELQNENLVLKDKLERLKKQEQGQLYFELQNELAFLKKKNNRLSDENNSLNSLTERMQKELENYKKASKQNLGSPEKLHRIEEIERQNEDIINLNKQYRNIIEELEKSLQQTLKEETKLKANDQQDKLDNDKLLKENQKLKSSYQELEKQYFNNEKAFQQLSEEYQTLQEQIRNMKQRKNSQDENNNLQYSLEKELTDLRNQSKKQWEFIESVEKENQLLKETKKDIELKHQKLIKELLDDIQKKESLIMELRTVLKQCDSEIVNLRSQVTIINDHDIQISELKEQLIKYKQQASEASNLLEKMTTTSSKLELESKNVRLENQEMQRQKLSLEKEIQYLRQKIQNMMNLNSKSEISTTTVTPVKQQQQQQGSAEKELQYLELRNKELLKRNYELREKFEKISEESNNKHHGSNNSQSNNSQKPVQKQQFLQQQQEKIVTPIKNNIINTSQKSQIQSNDQLTDQQVLDNYSSQMTFSPMVSGVSQIKQRDNSPLSIAQSCISQSYSIPNFSPNQQQIQQPHIQQPPLGYQQIITYVPVGQIPQYLYSNGQINSQMIPQQQYYLPQGNYIPSNINQKFSTPTQIHYAQPQSKGNERRIRGRIIQSEYSPLKSFTSQDQNHHVNQSQSRSASQNNIFDKNTSPLKHSEDQNFNLSAVRGLSISGYNDETDGSVN